jgi:hypothetical protein
MRVILKVCLISAAAAVVLAPVTVRADGYFTPWVGMSVLSATDEGHRAYGVTAGYMGAGVFGFEGDFAYSPEFFGSKDEFGANNAFTVLGNFILGVPIGGTHGAGVRPFVSGGFGLNRTHIEGGRILNLSRSTNSLAYDLGAGMMGFFNQHVGLRGDVRYLRLLDDTDPGLGTDFDPARRRYWRVSAGVTVR